MTTAQEESSAEIYPESEKDKPTSENVRKVFEDVYSNYLQTLNDIYIKGQEGYEGTHTNYLQALIDIQMDSQKCLEEIHRNYLGAMQEAWGQEDAQKRAEDAYCDCMKALQEGQESAQKGYEKSRQNYQEARQQVWEDTQKLNLEACQDYLRALQKAWQEIDVNTIDANAMTSISQSIMTASYYVSATLAAKA